jgi:hypothetical protein
MLLSSVKFTGYKMQPTLPKSGRSPFLGLVPCFSLGARPQGTVTSNCGSRDPVMPDNTVTSYEL